MTTPDPSLWLPAPARAKHDEPITAEAWERRERAWKAAEETIAKVFGERDKKLELTHNPIEGARHEDP